MSARAKFWALLAATLLGAFLLYLNGNERVGLWDRDEPWYAECSREMLTTGDWVVPRYLGDYREEKPALVYWCQAAVMAVIGQTGQAARFPSVLGVTGAGIVLGLVVRRAAGSRRALWATFIFCTSGLAIASAKMCLTDAVMLFFVACGQACLAYIYARQLKSIAYSPGSQPPPQPSPGVPGEGEIPIWIAAAFWVSVGLAGLTKGPQALGMQLMTLLVLCALDVRRFWSRRAWAEVIRPWWRSLRPGLGILILAVVTGPWMVLLQLRAPGVLRELFNKLLMHQSTSMEGHGELPGYHALLIFGTFFPWSIMLPAAIKLAWRNRPSPVMRFAIAAAVGPWLMMELVWTKLPFYVLPAFPALAFLTADALVRCLDGESDELKNRGFLAVVVVWAVAALGIAGSPWLLLKLGGEMPKVAMAIFSATGVVYVAMVVILFFRQKTGPAAVAMGIGMAAMIAILWAGIFPGIGALRLSEKLAADLRAHGALGYNTPAVMIGYKEPSLSFYQGGGIREQKDDYLTENPPSQWPRWIVIDDAIWKEQPPQIQARLHLLATEQGLDYSQGGQYRTIYLMEFPDGRR